MQNEISKTQNQFSDERSEKIQLDQLISSFHCSITYDMLRSSLKKVLKSNIGSVIIKKPKRSDISVAVNQLCCLFKFTRELLAYSCSECELNKLSTDKLMSLANEVNENQTEGVVMGCLAVWIKDFSDEKASLDFAKHISSKFKLLKLFIDECEKIGNALEEMEVSNG